MASASATARPRATEPRASARAPAGYDRFRHHLESACGIRLGENKSYLVRSRLAPVLEAHGLSSLEELVDRLDRPDSGALRAQSVDAMTTNETLWFRDVHPFLALSERIFPERAALRRDAVRVWSSACSSGQEVYSIAMVWEERRRAIAPATRLEVYGTDISARALAEAEHAEYTEQAIARGLDPARRDAFFARSERGWQVLQHVRAHARFRRLNLLDSYATVGSFDAIFCRNVLIYFSAERKLDILSRMRERLLPGGYLMLGASELLPSGLEGYEPVNLSRGVVYRRVD